MIRPILLSVLTAISLVAMAGAGTAQGLFSPAIVVDDTVITNFELQQRVQLLKLLRAPGDPDRNARDQLIEDRLKLSAATAAGIEITEEDVEFGMEEFAARANLTAEEFVNGIGEAGVDEQTFRDFVRSGVAWRELVRARFAGQVQVNDDEVDRALSATGGGVGGVRVLVSEIIIPAPPDRAEEAQALASELSQINTLPEFAVAARQYSASASRAQGGRLSWVPITRLPPVLRPLILGLAPGEVTEPIPIPNAFAVFQLRAIEETGVEEPEIAAIEYALYYIGDGQSDGGRAEARKITDRIDTCDDLYGVNLGQPEERLERITLPPSEIPGDIALELAKLDKHEISTDLTRNNGGTRVLLMLCGRTPALVEDEARDQFVAALRNQRLSSLANGYLEQLRADARIEVR